MFLNVGAPGENLCEEREKTASPTQQAQIQTQNLRTLGHTCGAMRHPACNQKEQTNDGGMDHTAH